MKTRLEIKDRVKDRVKRLCEQYTCSVSLGLMVIPVTLSNGQNYDLSTILQLYEKAGGHLNYWGGNISSSVFSSDYEAKIITCSLTRDEIKVDQTKLPPCNRTIKNAVEETVDLCKLLSIEDKPDYTTLPPSESCVLFMLDIIKISENDCLKYLSGITEEDIERNKLIYYRLMLCAVDKSHIKILEKLHTIKPDLLKDKALKMGEWNKMMIKVVGDDVETWLNGTQMISFTDEKIGNGKGSIALQIHSKDGGDKIKVRWRNLYIENL